MNNTSMTITWKNFKVGDYLIHPTGDRCRVMAKSGELFARSSWQRFDVFQSWEGIEEARKQGYRFIQPGNKIEMKVEELEILMGHPIKII